MTAYWVKTSAESPSASASESISVSRSSLPDRPVSAPGFPIAWSGWLHTCFSRVMRASTWPRRSIPAAPRTSAIIASIVAW